MHRRGPLSLSLLLFVSLLIGHIPSHMVSSSNADDGWDPQKGLSPSDIDQTLESSNAVDIEAERKEDNGTENIETGNKEGNAHTSISIDGGTENTETRNNDDNGHTSTSSISGTKIIETGNKEGNGHTSTRSFSGTKNIETGNKEGNDHTSTSSISGTKIIETGNKEGNGHTSTSSFSGTKNIETGNKEGNGHTSTSSISGTKNIETGNTEGNDHTSTSSISGTKNIETGNKEGNGHTSTRSFSGTKNIETGNTEGNVHTSKRINVGIGDKYTENKDDNTGDKYIHQPIEEPDLQKENIEVSQKRHTESQLNGEEDISNLQNNTSSTTIDVNYEYELELRLSALLLISALFGYHKSKKNLHVIKSLLNNADSESTSHQEKEKLKNTLNTELKDAGILEENLKRYSGQVQRKREIILLPLRFSRESTSTQYCPLNFGEAPVEISRHDLLDYLQSRKYDINEVVSLESYHSGNIHRISADRSVSDIVREKIPDTGFFTLTIQKINMRRHERRNGRGINVNACRGGNQGEVLVISYEYTKTDIDENALYLGLMNLKSKEFKVCNIFKGNKCSQRCHSSEATQDNFEKSTEISEVRNNTNLSESTNSTCSLAEIDNKWGDVNKKELLKIIENLWDKLSLVKFFCDFTGGRNNSPMDSFEKGRFGNFNIGANEMHSTQSETMLINLGSYRKFPTGFITNDEVHRECLVSTLNILGSKGMLRDQFSVPPNVIDPFNVSFELTKEDLRRQRQMSSEWSQYFNERMSNYLLRYASFSDWPINAPFSATRLVTAGFFYDNQKRAIHCFNCGVEVNCTGGQLEMFAKQRISPIRFHLSLNPRCEYALSEMQRNEKVDAPNITTISQDNVSAIMNDLCVTDQETSAAPGTVPGMRSDMGKDVEITEGRRDILPDNVASYPEVANSDNNIPENRQGRHNHHSSYSSHDSPSGRTNVRIVQNSAFEYNYPVKSPAYKDIYSRLESYRGWPIRNIQDPKELVNAGFFYTNKKDIVRCFCCDIGLAEWDKDDDPWLEHARHSPDCKYLKEKQGQDFIDSVQLDWQQIYKPKHPAFNELQTRLDSFTGWPEELTQKPDVLAAAGFFYTGEGDVARCHYCDGGLREWEPGDDPWTEHARWFPYCKYLIKLKGLEYIEQIARQSKARQHGQASGQSNQVNGFSDDSILTNHQSTYQQQMTNNRENPMVTAAAETLLVMGYKRYEIQYVINRFIANHGNIHFNAENLLDIIMDMEDRGETIPEISENHSITNGISNEDIEPHLVQLENQRLKAQMLCVTCKKMDRRMLLVPCGHRLHCESCSKSVKRCPNCKKKVNKIVKTFLA